MTEVAYCTRETVQAALGQTDTVRNNARIDRAIVSASRDVEGYTRRRFYPTTATRYPDARLYVSGTTLWLDSMETEILSVSAFSIEGTSYVANTDYYLDGDGPGYDSLRLLDTGSAAFSITQRSIVLAGEFGASNATRAAGTLAAAILTAGATTMTISDSSLVGVGDLVTIGTERVIVTEKAYTATTATLTAGVAASNGTVTVPVSSGALVHAGESILINAERMFVEAVAGNNLTVRRAQNGLLGAHNSADAVYAPRIATIVRGATGTTAATHANADPLAVNDPPSLVHEAALALALVTLEQSKTGYGRVVGSGDNAREASGRGLSSILDDLVQRYGRVRIGVA